MKFELMYIQLTSQSPTAFLIGYGFIFIETALLNIYNTFEFKYSFKEERVNKSLLLTAALVEIPERFRLLYDYNLILVFPRLDCDAYK